VSEGDLVQLRLVFANTYLGGVTWNAVVSLHFRDKGGGDIMADLGADFIGNLGAVWFAQLSADTFLDHVEVWPVGWGDGFPVFTTPDPALQGSIDSQVVPHQVAALIRWKADVVGRPYEGRSYLYGGVSANVLFGNFWAETMLSAMHDIGDQMVFTYGQDGASTLAEFVIVSTRLHKEPRDSPLVTPVSSYEVGELLATQRRRLYFLVE
jgi:hypothetical protein